MHARTHTHTHTHTNTHTTQHNTHIPTSQTIPILRISLHGLKSISVSGQLSETFRLPIKSQPMLIAQNYGLHHSIARCLVSLETEFQFCDAFRCKMTAKILEHVIGELSDSEMNYWTALLSCAFLRTDYLTGHQVLLITSL